MLENIIQPFWFAVVQQAGAHPAWMVITWWICLVIAWIAAVVFLISGVEDLIYDIGLYFWKIFRRVKYRKRERLSLAKLRSRVQQRIAIFIPAWQEGEVIGETLDNIIHLIEYRNYTIFVGTYPNDPKTQQAVDALSKDHPQLIKVVNAEDGPTNKADCINAIYRAMKQFEETNGVNFDIVVMHDAEDVVHPYSLLLYNYLIPRVDAIQLPIFPLPTRHTRWVHWIYADEFAENHMKDLVVREKMTGLVPFAGVGTGFSRRALAILEEQDSDAIFNERTLTEDYNFGMKLKSAGLQSVFVNVLIPDEADRWYTPLAGRRGFIANWAFFPMGFKRSVRQKTRWIIGISLQEWEMSGWKGNSITKLNLVKDRKVFFTTAVNLLAYLLVIYVILAELGEHGYIPSILLPVIRKGTLLYTLVLIDTGIMLFRMLERVIFVSMVYGLVAGVLSLPRLVLGNILNGVATYRALLQYLRARQQGKRVAWDKTEHLEGNGYMPSESIVPAAARIRRPFALNDLAAACELGDSARLIDSLETIPRDISDSQRSRVIAVIGQAGDNADYQVRAAVARVCGFLAWSELSPVALHLLHDREWLVRANAARALINFTDLANIIAEVFREEDRYAWEIFIRTLELNQPMHPSLLTLLDTPKLSELREVVLDRSPLLRMKYDKTHQPARATVPAAR